MWNLFLGILEQTFTILVNNNMIKVPKGNHDTIRPSVDEMSKVKYILEDARLKKVRVQRSKGHSGL